MSSSCSRPRCGASCASSFRNSRRWTRRSGKTPKSSPPELFGRRDAPGGEKSAAAACPLLGRLEHALARCSLGLTHVEAVGVHHFRPGGNEVVDELLTGVGGA